MDSLSSYLRRSGPAVITIGLVGFAADYALNLGLSRALPPHDYGDFKVARTFAVFFGAAVLLGGDRAAPKALTGALERGEPGRAWEYLRFYFGIGVALSLVVIAITWTVSYLHVGDIDPTNHHVLAWMVLSVPFLAVGALASRTLQSARLPIRAALPWRVGLPILILAAVAVLAWLRPQAGLMEIVVASIGAVAAIMAWQWFDARRSVLPRVTRDLSAAEPRRWLATSLPMMGFFLVTLALAQSDLYLLEVLGDEHDVGLYAAAETTSHFLILIQTTIVGLMAPLLSSALEAGGEAQTSTYRQGQRLMLAGLAPAALLLVVAGGPILGLFGELYPQALPELRLLVVANFAWAAAALSGLVLQYTGRGHVVVVVATVTLVLDTALNALLIPRFGMLGAAASTAFTLALAGIALVIARRTESPPPGSVVQTRARGS